MKFVIQRVTQARVEIDGEAVGAIENGYVVLIGINKDDTKEVADKLIKKLVNLRIFEDENGKTNLNIDAVSGKLLLISQFTLYADCKHGNRPSFTDAAGPDIAEALYDYIVRECKGSLGEDRVQQGVFGGDMKVSLVNDGPFTIVLDSRDL